jgi:hypothetical protein
LPSTAVCPFVYFKFCPCLPTNNANKEQTMI